MLVIALLVICSIVAIALSLWPLRRSILAVGAVFLATYVWLFFAFDADINQPGVDGPGVIGAMFLMLLPAFLVALLVGLRIAWALLSLTYSMLANRLRNKIRESHATKRLLG
jgi:hypothetical protein